METLRRIRMLQGLNQVELAKASGVSQNTISEIETGRREARPATLRKLASALHVEIADFFEETDTVGKAQVPSLFDEGAGSLTLAERLQQYVGHADLLTKSESALARQIRTADPLMVDKMKLRWTEEFDWLSKERKRHPAPGGWPWHEPFSAVVRKHLSLSLLAARKSRENQEALKRLISQLEDHDAQQAPQGRSA